MPKFRTKRISSEVLDPLKKAIQIISVNKDISITSIVNDSLKMYISACLQDPSISDLVKSQICELLSQVQPEK